MFSFSSAQPGIPDHDSMYLVCYGAGVILFAGSLALAGWNEYRSVATEKTIAAASDNVHEISCGVVLPSNEGLLVHAACDLSNFKSFRGFPGLSQLSDSEVTGIRLQQSAQVPNFLGCRDFCQLLPCFDSCAACQSGLRLIDSLATCSGVRVARDRHIEDHQGPGLPTRPRRTQRALQPQP